MSKIISSNIHVDIYERGIGPVISQKRDERNKRIEGGKTQKEVREHRSYQDDLFFSDAWCTFSGIFNPWSTASLTFLSISSPSLFSCCAAADCWSPFQFPAPPRPPKAPPRTGAALRLAATAAAVSVASSSSCLRADSLLSTKFPAPPRPPRLMPDEEDLEIAAASGGRAAASSS